MTYIFKEIFLILSLYYIFTKSDLIFFIKQVLSAFLLHYKCKTVVIEKFKYLIYKVCRVRSRSRNLKSKNFLLNSVIMANEILCSGDCNCLGQWKPQWKFRDWVKFSTRKNHGMNKKQWLTAQMNWSFVTSYNCTRLITVDRSRLNIWPNRRRSLIFPSVAIE